MVETAILFLLGGAGAMFYAFPVFVAARRAGQDGYSFTILCFSIGVGALFGGVLTPWIGARAPWTVDPEPYPLALVLGLLANPLLPRIVDRGTQIFNALSIGGGNQK